MPHSLKPLRPGEPVAADRFNEVIDRLNVLSGITGAYPIEVQRQAGGLQVSLARQFKAWLFQIQPFDGPAPTTSDNVPFYAGVRVRLDASDEYAAHEPADVTLFDPLAKDRPERQLHEGDWALATHNADNGRWEIVRDPGGRGAVVRFRTTATLALGGTAAAVIREWDGAAYQDGDAITVEDWSTPGRFSAVNGAEGVAVKLADKDEYVILWIEHQAIFATAQLTANMTAGTAACTFTDTWQGPSGVGAASQVYDIDGRYAGLVIGDKVLACWDDVESKYKICDGPQDSKERWAYARTDWVNAAANGSYVPCDSATGKDGVSTGIDIGNVYLLRGGDYDPDVRQGEIIAYTIAEDGFKIAKGYVSDRIGTIKIWSGSAATIARGWQLCDGANGTPDLRERFVLGAFGDSGGTADFDYGGHSTNVGATGGLRRELVNWAHTAFGSEVMRTFDTVQEILQTESFHTEKEDPPLAISASGARTDYAVTGLAIVTEQGKTDGAGTHQAEHHDHLHIYEYDTTSLAAGASENYNPTGPLNCDETHLATSTQLRAAASCPEPALVFEHYLVEPGAAAVGAFNNPPIDAGDPHQGHFHYLSGLLVSLVWDTGVYDGHFHNVFAGTLDGVLHIRDVTHNSPAGVPLDAHYHDLWIDNHQEYINRIPPYYALCYIQRIN
jgi:hypothetical protein